MNYLDVAQALYYRIEEAIDVLIETEQAPLDYENTGGVLTIDCEDSDTQVIVSRQQATEQIWVAAKSGGFHCSYDDGLWRCRTTKETLQALLSRVCSEQSQTPIVFNNID